MTVDPDYSYAGEVAFVGADGVPAVWGGVYARPMFQLINDLAGAGEVGYESARWPEPLACHDLDADQGFSD